MVGIRRIYAGWLVELLIIAAVIPGWAQQPLSLGRLPNGNEVRVVQNPDKSYGLRIGFNLDGAYPVRFFYTDSTGRQPGGMLYHENQYGYQTLARNGDTLIGTVDCSKMMSSDGTVARVTDRWLRQGNELRLWRRVYVPVGSPGGFATGTTFFRRVGYASGDDRAKLTVRSQYEQFVPGLMYGGTDNLPPKAIGSPMNYQKAHSRILIREDRLPMPLLAVRMVDGFSVAMLNPQPTGGTTREDSENFVRNGPDTSSRTAPNQLIDERFTLGSLNSSLETNALNRSGDSLENRLHLGYVYPALEGDITYRGNTYPDVGERAMRLNFHPLKEGLTQQYSLIFRFTQTENFPQLMRESWRWAWEKLKPAVNPHDIALAQRSLVAQLSSQVEERPSGMVGITNWRPAVPNNSEKDPKTVLGFTGKALETAELLLWASDQPWSGDSAGVYRRKGEGLFRQFIKLKLNPPVGEGFDMNTGQPALAIPKDGQVYLRSFGDDIKATLRAYRREKRAGRDHTDWLTWARQFGDWLLTEQRPADGGIPRSWKPGTGEVADASATSTYNAVPMLLLLSELTKDDAYRQAAIRAGEYSWQQSGQRFGRGPTLRFTGGTIDNPDVLDKEAGTLSLEAYLALYETTKETKWLDRAKAAADFAETWMYAWNVPMPADADDRNLHWKKGVPTVGLQLISTGHSLADAYMAFDADEYAKLFRYTGDHHYLDVAKLLLHNTLAMTALPGRTYDLRGPGWQQEHWSLAPWRGHGFHRGWLPWVSCSHLNGMIGLAEFDRALYNQLSSP